MAGVAVCSRLQAAISGRPDLPQMSSGPFQGEVSGHGSPLKLGSTSKHLSTRQQMRLQKARSRRASWRMEVADPLENFRDSFGNDCAVERRARKKLEMSDAYKSLAAEVASLKTRMAGLVSYELYEEACVVRDQLATLQLQKRVLEISAKPQVLYRVGDVITHRRYGYRGVIYGHDPECSAPLEWQEAMKIDMLPEGRNQPFYHVLVDTRDRPGGMSTYVAQENLALQRQPGPILHPWIPKFFVGFQEDIYVPGPKLRQVYPNDW